ncbi:hypothetical protein FXO38_34835 [Capsicum annuum]|nr:hypothetical protein FXO38_34835 [Capsicum annuum]
MTITEIRPKAMEDNMKKLKNQLQNHITESSKRAEVSEAKMDDLSRKMDLLMERLLPHSAKILGSAQGRIIKTMGKVTNKGWLWSVLRTMAMAMREVFPLQSHNEPRAEVGGGNSSTQWTTEAWYLSYQLSKGSITWREFCENVQSTGNIKRNKGLCYRCGDKYFPSYQCMPKQINAITAIKEGQGLEEYEEMMEEVMVQGEGTMPELQEEFIMDEAISLNALLGTKVPNTIKLSGESKKNKLTICWTPGVFIASWI